MKWLRSKLLRWLNPCKDCIFSFYDEDEEVEYDRSDGVPIGTTTNGIDLDIFPNKETYGNE